MELVGEHKNKMISKKNVAREEIIMRPFINRLQLWVLNLFD